MYIMPLFIGTVPIHILYYLGRYVGTVCTGPTWVGTYYLRVNYKKLSLGGCL
jgi:hypothetical protein